MTKNVAMSRITGTAQTFSVALVEDGYMRLCGGMLAFGRRGGNKRRDELCVEITDVKAFIAEYENNATKAEAALAGDREPFGQSR